MTPGLADEGPLEVVIAGGGVAGLEALIALRRLAGPRVHVELLAPEHEFVNRPMSVAEPFGLARPLRLDLAEVAAAHDARYRCDALVEVDAEPRELRTAAGRTLSYHALIVAIGAQPVEALPGALTFRGPADTAAFAALLSEIELGRVRSVAFAVPNSVRWPLPAYELALMTAAHLESAHTHRARLALVTHEAWPLEVFGRTASRAVGRMLEQAGIELATGSAPTAHEGGVLLLEGGAELEAERAVSLPALRVPAIPGVPQDAEGFVPVDRYGRVEGLELVFAAGDATSFPIKQGGVAAQQADTVAAAVAALAGADVAPEPLPPVLRAALLTGSAPQFLRTALDEPDAASEAGRSVLWWPPGKIAGRYLAPYLADRARGPAGPPLDDVEPLFGEDRAAAEAGRVEALELALTAADADARWGDHDSALKWLEAAEQLNVALPREYAERRREWSAELLRERADATLHRHGESR